MGKFAVCKGKMTALGVTAGSCILYFLINKCAKSLYDLPPFYPQTLDNLILKYIVYLLLYNFTAF
jgi:hypothetical protein